MSIPDNLYDHPNTSGGVIAAVIIAFVIAIYGMVTVLDDHARIKLLEKELQKHGIVIPTEVPQPTDLYGQG